MKKIIPFFLLLVGCGYAPIDTCTQSMIITNIDECENNQAKYYGQGNDSKVYTLCEHSFMFIDSCGKFQVGDKVKFVKQ